MKVRVNEKVFGCLFSRKLVSTAVHCYTDDTCIIKNDHVIIIV